MSTSFKSEKYKAFGWVLHRKMLEVGANFKVEIPAEYSPKDGHNISLWTVGKVEGYCSLSKKATEVKVPGCSILNKISVPKSDIIFTAAEYSEFWCINYTLNRNKLPDVSILNIPKGTSVLLPLGSKVLFCEGTFSIKNTTHSSPKSLRFQSGDIEIIAETSTYGFIFEKET